MAGMNAGSKISSARGGLEDEVRAQEYGGKEATGREVDRGQNINDCFLLVLFVVLVFATDSHIAQASL